MAAMHAYGELIVVPRNAVSLPLQLPPPDGFVPDRPETWPSVEGQLEYVGGKLYYTPPTGDRQQDTSADVVATLVAWRKKHPEFTVGGNEAGMILGGETRGADAAIWRSTDLGPRDGRYRRVAPILAVEVKGELEDEAALRAKAAWYLAHGVEIVWVLSPAALRAVVHTRDGERAVGMGERMPPHPALPDLEPELTELFDQIAGPAVPR